MDNSNLTINGQKELQKYLNFFNLKKQESMKEMQLDFDEFREVQVPDMIYNKDDVGDIIDKIQKQVQQQMEKDFSKMIHMSGVYVKIFLCEAQANNVEFQADFHFIENLKIIEEMKVLEKGGSIVQDSQDQSQTKSKMYSRLPTIDSAQQCNFYIAYILQEKQEELQKEVERLKIFNQKLQNELITLKKSSVNDKTSIEEAQNLEKLVEQLKIRNQELQAESQVKLNESVQFKNLKTMVQQKNEKIKELQDKQQLFKAILLKITKIRTNLTT